MADGAAGGPDRSTVKKGDRISLGRQSHRAERPAGKSMNVDIRPVSADDLESFQQTFSVPMGFDPTPEFAARFQKVFELQRLRAAFDGHDMIATFGAFSFTMAVPGSTLPVAGTTVVAVLPTHRRQGVLRSMMTEHLAEVHKNNEPLAALWASESSIYGRFGYGPSSERAVMTLDKSYARLRESISIRGTMRLVDQAEALNVLPEIFNHAARQRPGMFQRSRDWWEHRVLADLESMRGGATAQRRVVHMRSGKPVGYVLYRTKEDSAVNANQLQLVELVGIDPEAEKALWQYLFGIDLTCSITYWNQPVDDPLRWWLEQPRRMERRIEDALWIRPVDVPTALSGRQYSCAGAVAIRLCDPLCPWNDGVYDLEVDQDGTAHCQAGRGDPEIAMTPEALGAVYLGGHRFRDLARSGVITGTVDALRRADALFAWDPLPWCQEVF